MAWIAPLDLQTILVNTLSGSMEIFIFLSMIAIAGLAAYFRMINTTLLIMFALFGILIGQFAGGLYFLTILVVGLLFALVLSRLKTL